MHLLCLYCLPIELNIALGAITGSFLTPENFHPSCPNFVTAGVLQKKNSITDWSQLLILRQHETLIIEMTVLGTKTDIAFISLISG